MKIKLTTSFSRSNTRMEAIHRCVLVLLVAATPNTYAAQNQQQSLQQGQGQQDQSQGQTQSQSQPQAQKQISKSQRSQKAQQVSQQNSKQRSEQQSDKPLSRNGSQKSNGKKLYASNKNEAHEQMASNKDVRQFHEVLNDSYRVFL